MLPPDGASAVYRLAPQKRLNMNVEMSALRIPLKVPVAHASHARVTGESIFAVARRGEHVGLGEGCPRSYVTGENMGGSLEWLRSRHEAIERIASLADLDAFARDEEAAIARHPGAFCAMESALLDVLAREAGVSIEALLGVPALPEALRYTAVLFDAPIPMFEWLVGQHREAGFREWKFRICGDLAIDRQRLDLIRATDRDRIRIQSLIDQGLLTKDEGGGRSTSYSLILE
jgi:L-Ala-D/L-Glu epimerase